MFGGWELYVYTKRYYTTRIYAFLGALLAQITTFHKMHLISTSLGEFPENHLNGWDLVKSIDLGEKSTYKRHEKRFV